MPTADTALWEDVFYLARDGLRLHARRYPAASPSGARPALCLPGLSRNGRDFHDLAMALASDRERPRDVFAVDYRGRGESAFDPDWENYTPLIELGDTLDLMAIFGLHHAAVIGTSRGGLIAMSMAAVRPTAMGAVVLNDIGPVIESRGLARIMSIIGKLPLPGDWPAAANQVRELNEKAFTAIPAEQWSEIARAFFNEKDGKPAPGYDPALANALGAIDLTKPVPELWEQFEALTPFPALLLRGANSDLLSAETAEAMVARHPNLECLTVAGQGHAPFLKDDATISAIARFLAAND